MKDKLEQNYRGIQIAGMYAPPYRPLTDKEDEEVIKLINAANPDIIWVGLGAPKQEIWMSEHEGRVNGVMIGVGAGFDFFAGNVKRAPLIVQKLGLEWLHRLLQDPKRLWKRYVTTNYKFVKYILKEKRRRNA
jgi:N-acetylglucosaminyldiphosphoundecaprenol N-acetyl-beta-D-mannosaminyltransferase